MYSIIISFVMYFVSAHYINKLIDDYLPPGSARKLVVFLIASIISWLVGAVIDWAFPAQAISLFGI